jgi:hypothetical protein
MLLAFAKVFLLQQMALPKCYQQDIFYNEVILKNLNNSTLYISYNNSCVNCFLGTNHYECLSFPFSSIYTVDKSCDKNTAGSYNCYYEGKLPAVKTSSCCSPLLKDLLYNNSIRYPGLGEPCCNNENCIWSAYCLGYSEYKCYSGSEAIICQKWIGNGAPEDGYETCNIEASLSNTTGSSYKVIHNINCTNSLPSFTTSSSPTSTQTATFTNNSNNINTSWNLYLIIFLNVLLLCIE